MKTRNIIFIVIGVGLLILILFWLVIFLNNNGIMDFSRTLSIISDKVPTTSSSSGVNIG